MGKEFPPPGSSNCFIRLYQLKGQKVEKARQGVSSTITISTTVASDKKRIQVKSVKFFKFRKCVQYKASYLFHKVFCISFKQLTVNRFKLFQSVSQNSNSSVTFYTPLCCHVSKSFIFLSTYLKKFIILLDNRTEQNNTSGHSTWYYFAEKNQVSFPSM